MDESVSEGPFGLRIDGLEWHERLGRGGFSVVYRAVQTRLDRQVAVKVLTTDLSDPVDVRRFETECRLMGRLGAHRHIVDVHDAGVGSGGQPYIVMKYYTGGTLASLVADEGALAPEKVADIGAKLADALATAHAAGVIHRDVKAENVLLDEYGEPVMADFGVAAVADPDGRYTSSIAFSRAYVAPEVLDRNEYGPASDIYSLGATLYTLLTGRPVFSASSEARTVLAVLDDAPAPLGRADVPPALEALVLTCLAKDPAARPATAAGLAAQLAALRQSPTGDTGTASSATPGRATAEVQDMSTSAATMLAGPGRTQGTERSSDPSNATGSGLESDVDDRTVRRSPRTPDDVAANSPSSQPISSPPSSHAREDAERRPARKTRTPRPFLIGVTALVLGLAAMLITWRVIHSPRTYTQVSTFAIDDRAASASARAIQPTGVAAAEDGTVYIASLYQSAIKRVAPDGTVSLLAGGVHGSFDGQGPGAQFGAPGSLALAPDGAVVVTDLESHTIRRVDTRGVTTTVAGSIKGYKDGPSAAARFNSPNGVAVSADGSIYVADTANHRIRKVSADGSTVSTVAGGTQGYKDGPGSEARFSEPWSIAISDDGSLIVADSGNHRLRRIDAAGNVTTFAGSGEGDVDGSADVAKFGFPSSVAAADHGSYIVTDSVNHNVRRITSDGTVSTIAGSIDGLKDGPAADAQFSSPFYVAVRADGAVLVSDTKNDRVRLVT